MIPQRFTAMALKLILMICLYSVCTCQGCSISEDCNNRASSVTQTTEGCQCTCINSWQGSQCQLCPTKYSMVDNCAACASGYMGAYPDCVVTDCTQVDCNNRAINISGSKASGCTCFCRNSWKGTECGICPHGVDQTTDCSACSAGYEGYPQCSLLCTIPNNCSNHATDVNGTSVTGCNCTCRNQWSGGQCDNCASIYDLSTDCGTCAPGYGGYPNCVEQCTNTRDCSGRATSVSGSPPVCNCTCRNSWQGTKCDSCPPLIESRQDCGACITDYVNYPNCVKGCSKKLNCSNHAQSVSGNELVGCNCTCRNAWQGSNCSVCPSGVDVSADCGSCLTGYGGYPNCQPICLASDCSNHASSITGNPTIGCNCTCRNQWAGLKCETCPTLFDPNQDCGSCYAGFGPMPICNRMCTSMLDCNDHASNTKGFHPNCTCTCRNKWSGKECDQCLSPFIGSDCNNCVSGYNGYPFCARMCTIEANCSSGASSVTGNDRVGCTCNCNNSWFGSRCTECPFLFDRNKDCAACSAGYIGNYPNCYIACTFANCSNHAGNVSGDSGSGCSCMCRNKWSGSSCAYCSSIYNKTEDCGKCINGYDGYPSCSQLCTSKANCGDHAANVSGTYATGCQCTCRNLWYGSTCKSCPSLVDKNKDCGKCISTATGYPNCVRNCTTQSDCNNRATAVTGTSVTGCNCTCRNSWTGTTCASCSSKYDRYKDCGSCASGYGGEYPSCTLLCSKSVDCSNRAASVEGVKGNCSCTCRNRWEGTKCQTCPTGYRAYSDCGTCSVGYNGYPDCGPECTINQDCSGHANVVTGNLKIGCNCTCRNKWETPTTNCSVCPIGYDATRDCGACATNYSGYPKCTRMCTLEEDCSINTVSVTGDFFSGCKCHCRNHWSGDRCTTCPVGFNTSDDCNSCSVNYTGFPACSHLCSIDRNCSNHASSVTGTDSTGCYCNCRNQWWGYRCQFCSSTYDSKQDCGVCLNPNYDNYPRCTGSCQTATCPLAGQTPSLSGTGCHCYPGNYCAIGWIEYPKCFLDANCTNEYDCTNRSTNVTGTRRTGCQCTCRNSWYSYRCWWCPRKYNRDTDCRGCAPDYEGTYPNCSYKCFTTANCSGHAWSVTGNSNVGCNCRCAYAWTGEDCSICPKGVNPATQCSSCLAGYERYPDCYLSCTVAANCSGKATAVSGNENIGCRCTCAHQWTGPNCSTCPVGFRQSDCAGCAVGWLGYPQCSPVCTNEGNCSNHAANVSGTWRTGCGCICRNQWEGLNCSYCPIQYNETKDCGACRDGFFGYPNCVRKCTLEDDCSKHATNVTGDGERGCNCSCRNSWSGSNCAICPIGFNANSSDCDECTDGYTDYPRCIRTCTWKDDCNDHAVNVTGNGEIGCNCTCRHYWYDATCASCPVDFNPNQDCNACARNYSGLVPNCFKDCTNDDNCTGHADWVEGHANTTCHCHCRNQWTGPTCSICPLGIEPATDCNSCISGYHGFPNCKRTCSILADCNGQATSVAGYVSTNQTTCNCTCRNQWAGSQCSACPAAFSATNDCGACSSLYDGIYPNCALECTVASNCTNHASTVVGTSSTGCNCTCDKQWNGSNCENCPFPFDEYQNCAACVTGFGGYPNCTRDCTAMDCFNRSVSVVGNIGEGCNCNCRNGWTGGNCSTCPFGFNITDDCGSCITNYSGYPKCSRSCRINDDCNGHAKSVVGNTYDGCNCTCRNAWQGETCGMCPVGTNASIDCGACIPGYIGYPNCDLKCTNAANCSNHATTVSGTMAAGCTCKCQTLWQGKPCDFCPDGVDASANCGSCQSGYTGYPNCSRQCYLSDCSFHATGVAGDTRTGCQCTCRAQWTGNNCSVCPDQYDPEYDCGQCRQGYFGYPTCSRPCIVYKDCSNHANDATGSAPNCSCTCRNKWGGGNCSICPFPYGGYDCHTCQEGYAGYPKCDIACTNSLNCSNHAATVTGTYSTGCSCNCRNRWGGEQCQVCPPQYAKDLDCAGCAKGYEGIYPTCYLKCTVNANCSGRATRAAGNTNLGCYCECRARWKGGSCSNCSSVYNESLDCSGCANGFENYPQCSPIPTTLPPKTIPVPTNATPVQTNATDSPTPLLTNTTPAPTNATLLPTNTTPAPTNATLLPTNTTPAPTNATPAPTNSTPLVTNITPSAPSTTLVPTNASETVTPLITNASTVVPSNTAPLSTNASEGPTTTIPTSTVVPDTSASPATPTITGTVGPTETTAPVSSTVTSQIPTTEEPKTQGITTGSSTVVPVTTSSVPPTTETTTAVSSATPESSTSTGTVVSSSTPLPLTCSVAGNCSQHAENVTLSAAEGKCLCTCRNRWTSMDCSRCMQRYNTTLDCGTCAAGYIHYPSCACRYAVSGSLHLIAKNNVTVPKLSSELVTGLSKDVHQFVASNCIKVRTSETEVRDYVIDVKAVGTSGNVVSIGIIVTDNSSCVPPKETTQCLAAALKVCSMSFPNTLQSTSIDYSCGASAFQASQTNPCATFVSCAAAEAQLLEGLAPADVEEEKKPIWVYVIIGIAIILLLALIYFIYKRVYIGRKEKWREAKLIDRHTREFKVFDTDADMFKNPIGLMADELVQDVTQELTMIATQRGGFVPVNLVNCPPSEGTNRSVDLPRDDEVTQQRLEEDDPLVGHVSRARSISFSDV